MVADFGGIKALVQHHIVAPWDHAFLAYARDRAVLDFLATLPGHRTVTFEAPPTAEHLAATALRILAPAFAAAYGDRLHVEQVRIYETPNCWADALRADNKTLDFSDLAGPVRLSYTCKPVRVVTIPARPRLSYARVAVFLFSNSKTRVEVRDLPYRASTYSKPRLRSRFFLAPPSAHYQHGDVGVREHF